MPTEFAHMKNPRLRIMKNAQLLSFIDFTIEEIRQAGADKLGVTPYLEDFTTQYELLSDIAFEPKALAETEKMKEADRKRDNQMRIIVGMVNLAMLSEEDETRAAAERIARLIKGSSKMPYKPKRIKSSLISATLLDLEKPGNQSSVKLLGLLPPMNKLRQYNERFNELNLQRVVRRAAKRGEQVKTCRQQIYTLYNVIMDTAFSWSIIHPSPEADLFIQHINGHIAEAKTSARRSAAQKKRGQNESEVEEGKE